MAVRRLTPPDLDWLVERLDARRRALTPFAPVYWRPAPDARTRHRDYLAFLLSEGGAVGFRTDDDLIVAQPRGLGWLIDDAAVADDKWDSDALQLWEALRSEVAGSMRWTCPVPERARLDFAESRGFRRTESWWHHHTSGELSTVDGDGLVHVAGASARLVPAPPVYAPGGPILFLTDVRDPASALGQALSTSRRCGSPVVVVSQPAADSTLGEQLEAHDFTRHCDFLDGSV